eukprot:TRINITY_DN150_c0_g1_i6.p1 TRINITY_DN150_c0_g1~~TRINITY_DN150_c0_g1_i6.p1  ORF type:complete len:541 (-),score=66.48 TRINITY_DN150_c0_g1_i6:170-1741(-)
MQRRLTNFSLPPTTPRQSEVGSQGQRLSSIGQENNYQLNLANKRTSYAGKDPRNVGDKPYTKACLERLSKYLESHGYEGDCSRKRLSNPSTNDFISIVNFLQYQFDSDAKQITNPSDDVPALFKRIQYPFQINQRLLVTVAAPHTWPHLVAALAYLVDVLNTLEMDEAEEMDQDDWIAQAYHCSMGGNEVQAREIEDNVCQQFEQTKESLVQECQWLEVANEEIQQEILALRNQPSALENATQQKAKKEQDIQKLEQSIQNHKQVMEKGSKKMEEQHHEMGRQREQLQSIQKEIGDLNSRVEQQPYTKADVSRMEGELTKSRGIYNQYQQMREQLEGQYRDQELQAASLCQQLEENLRNHNLKCHQLKLIPSTSKRAEGAQFEIHINREAQEISSILSLNPRTVEAALEQVLNRYKSRTWELSQQQYTLDEWAYLGKEQLEQIRTRNMQLASEAEQMEGSIRKVQQETEQVNVFVKEAKLLHPRLPQAALSAGIAKSADTLLGIALKRNPKEQRGAARQKFGR